MRRRIATAAFAALLLLAQLAAAQSAPLVGAVAAIEMTVSDMDRSLAFYTGVLGFQPLADIASSDAAAPRVARLRLGDEVLELVEYRGGPGRPIPADSRSQDGWFQHIAIVVSDFDRAAAWLRANRVEPVSRAPQRLPQWNPAVAGIGAYYFKDPDRHVLEILHFPPGKGAAKWQRRSDALFLGIDHTAIVVADTDASLHFYRDRLGLVVAGGSENSGIEQERLSNVPGARVRITSLRAAAGPGIELLHYLAPRDGRPLPSDQTAADLAHWQTQLITTDVRRAAALLGETRMPPITTSDDGARHDERGAHTVLVRDPDGHAMELVQP
jgi:catechol 2,3-dioxygenase-like lactoylglutathione lyase family enzyme